MGNKAHPRRHVGSRCTCSTTSRPTTRRKAGTSTLTGARARPPPPISKPTKPIGATTSRPSPQRLTVSWPSCVGRSGSPWRGGALATMPYVGLLEEDNVRKGFFERAEFDAILTHPPADLRPPLEFLFTTGWRKSEVLSFTVAHVDLDAGTVKLDVGTTKSGEGRTFILTPALSTLLAQQLDSIDALKNRGTICPWVFHRANGTRIKSLRAAWDAAKTAAGYPNKILHDFRRTAVRNL